MGQPKPLPHTISHFLKLQIPNECKECMEKLPSNPLTVYNNSCSGDFLNWTPFLHILMVFSDIDFFLFFQEKFQCLKTPGSGSSTTQSDPISIRNPLVLWILTLNFCVLQCNVSLCSGWNLNGKFIPNSGCFFT